jgi:hypothetical protein
MGEETPGIPRGLVNGPTYDSAKRKAWNHLNLSIDHQISHENWGVFANRNLGGGAPHSLV